MNKLGKQKMNPLVIVVLIIAGVWAVQNFGGTGAGQGDSPVDLSAVVQSEASFTAVRTYKTATALTSEWVRVIKEGGIDLGQISLNSGTQNTEPNARYDLYFGENSSTYYTKVVSYIASPVEATEDVKEDLCTMDTAPSITSYDEDEAVNEAGSNIQAIGSDETVTMYVRVKAAADKCFGNPDPAAPDPAICFEYNSSNYVDIETNTGASEIPYAISDAKAALYALKCYKLPKIADSANTGRIPVTITANGDPTALNGNITIKITDAGFDLDADTLAPIWGFQDEDNNALGSATTTSGLLSVS